MAQHTTEVSGELQHFAPNASLCWHTGRRPDAHGALCWEARTTQISLPSSRLASPVTSHVQVHDWFDHAYIRQPQRRQARWRLAYDLALQHWPYGLERQLPRATRRQA